MCFNSCENAGIWKLEKKNKNSGKFMDGPWEVCLEVCLEKKTNSVEH